MLVKEIISIAISAYFIWHIFIIIKCRPKKELLSDEQIENLKKDRNKRIIRKLLLKEPITKWNPAAVCIAIDLYVIVHFLEVLVR